jgi:hypothetical protein
VINVSYVTSGNENIASFRYRVLAPAKGLAKHFIKPSIGRLASKESGVVVFSKHWTYNDWSYAKFCKLRGQKVIFDVCDDHFEGKLSDHYRRMVDVADAITCNSTAMAVTIAKKTGRGSEVIADPVLSPRMEPRFKEQVNLTWYGQSMNIHGLFDVYTKDCLYPLEVAVPGNIQPPEYFQAPWITWVPWHKDVIPEVADRNNIALLPYRQGKDAKSANRVLEALQCGMMVLTDPIPAVVELGNNGIRYLDKPLNEVIESIKDSDWTHEILEAQKMIDETYSQEVIADKWAQVFRSLA